MKALVPNVRYVPVSSGSQPAAQPLLLPLREAMPLPAFLAPLGLYKDSITACIEGLALDVTVRRSVN